MNDPSIHTGAVTLTEVAQLDWGAEFQPLNHPIKTGIASNAEHIVDLKTGTTIARVEPGYKWYWFHSHLHIRPEDYERDADAQEKIRLEGGKTEKIKDPAVWLGRAIGDIEKALGSTEDDERRKRYKDIRTILEKELTEIDGGAVGVALFMQKFFANMGQQQSPAEAQKESTHDAQK